jgi:hypothetical protein
MNRNIGRRISVSLMIIFLAVPPELFSQETEQPVVFKQEELEQLVAPIALHPDSLIAQILMASTYPLEVALADRWTKQNASLKGDALTKALEGQDWDPERQIAGQFPSGAHDDEREARLDTETRRCVFGGPEKSSRYDSEPPVKSTGSG